MDGLLEGSHPIFGVSTSALVTGKAAGRSNRFASARPTEPTYGLTPS